MDITIEESLEDPCFEDDLLVTVKCAVREAEAAKDDLEKVLAEKEELMEEIKTLKSRINDLEQEHEKRESDLRAENERQKELIAELEAQTKTSRPSIIEEEEDNELDIPVTPSHPRQSIGQWSVERKRNNMSVKSMVSSMEKSRSAKKTDK